MKLHQCIYRKAFDSSKDGIILIDIDTAQIIDANPYLLDLLGYTSSELLGKIYWEIGALKDVIGIKDYYNQVSRESGYIRYGDVGLKTKDGRDITVEIVAKIYTVDNKKILQCSFHNITGRSMMEEEINRLNEELEQNVAKRTSELRNALDRVSELNREMVFRLLKASEYRDDETGRHIIRVSRYSRIIAENLGLENEFCELVENASPMHDIGKIGIPDTILLKPARLTPEEFEVIKKHPTIGTNLLKGSGFPLLKMGAEIALSHHEKWDGGGYPSGLKGEDIPISGRIVALADVFDALTTLRRYKKVIPWDEALNIIIQESGKSFDPHIVDSFFKGIDKIRSVYSEYKDADLRIPH